MDRNRPSGVTDINRKNRNEEYTMEIIKGGVTSGKRIPGRFHSGGDQISGKNRYGYDICGESLQSGGNLYHQRGKSGSGEMGSGDRIPPSRGAGDRVQQRHRQRLHRRRGVRILPGRRQKAAAEVLHVPEDSVLVASTGVIGMQLPIEKLAAGVKQMAPELDGSLEAGNLAAKAIMTTDTVEKEAAVQVEISGKTVTVGGMCKGSGMIHPNMCTMLSFVTTDVNISKELLQEALSESVKDTYNMVSVDGDTSTNDTVLLLAGGMAGNPEIT